jgi:hypothetical protein
MKPQRLGGFAAIASVCAYIILVAFASLRLRQFGDLSDPVKAMSALSAAPVDFYMVNLLLIVCYILWLIATYALYECMQADAPHLTRMALIAASAGTATGIAAAIVSTKAIGMIAPMQDISAYRAFNAIADGLNAMGGHAYGWVGLLIGCAVLKTRAFSRIPGWLFLLAGILWVRIPIPIPTGLGFINLIPWIFCIVSFVWFGIALIRYKQPQPASKEMPASR